MWRESYLKKRGYAPTVLIRCDKGAEENSCDCGQEGRWRRHERADDGSKAMRVPWQVQVGGIA